MNESSMNKGLLSHSATRIGLLIAVPVAVVTGIQAVSQAVPLKSWTSGETLHATDLNANFESLNNALTAISAPRAWIPCGTLNDLNGANQCELPNFPPAGFEYGFVHNGAEVHVADCLAWNVGLRVVNRYPYMVDSDNPTSGTMGLGGVILYTGTNATDDNTPTACPAGTWRHHYWKITDGSVQLFSGNGCRNSPLFCRPR